MVLTQADAKVKIHTLLNKVTRDGNARLAAALDTSDYFDAPASSCFHDAVPGGLAIHSLKVYELFKGKVETFNIGLSPESVIIVSLLHDLCKLGFYTIASKPMTDKQREYLFGMVIKRGEDTAQYNKASTRYASALIEYYKGETTVKPIPTIEYTIDDRFPIGHGEKSLILASKYLTLTEEEACIIRWHMNAWDMSVHFDHSNGKIFNTAIRMYPSIIAFFTADYEASHLNKTNW